MIATQSLLLRAVLFSFYAGAFLGALYDLLGIRRASARAEAYPPGYRGILPSGLRRRITKQLHRIDLVIIFFEDIIFCAISAAMISVTAFRFYHGNVRGIIVFAAAVGFAVYRATLGRIVRYLSIRIIIFLRRITAFVLKITLLPMISAVIRLCSAISGRIISARRRRRTISYASERLSEAENPILKAKR